MKQTVISDTTKHLIYLFGYNRQAIFLYILYFPRVVHPKTSVIACPVPFQDLPINLT